MPNPTTEAYRLQLVPEDVVIMHELLVRAYLGSYETMLENALVFLDQLCFVVDAGCRIVLRDETRRRQYEFVVPIHEFKGPLTYQGVYEVSRPNSAIEIPTNPKIESLIDLFVRSDNGDDRTIVVRRALSVYCHVLQHCLGTCWRVAALMPPDSKPLSLGIPGYIYSPSARNRT